ncbi:MAG TPA: TonB family protein [Nannocystaceae bacterium]|nr:TonB family protein [Nannocystaceae bacterium]
MFDVYMHAHAIDPRAQRTMVALVGVATLATALSIGTAMVGERLGVTRVGAPQVEGILVLPMDVTVAPLVPPPPKLEPTRDDAAAATVASSPDPKPHVDRELAPIEDAQATHPPATRLGPDVTGPTSLMRSTAPPHLACVVPGTCATAPPRPPKPPAPPARTFESIDVTRERALASPDPPTDQLARTPAGITRRSGSSTVAFCVGTDGKTTDVRTRKSSGDPDVDRICRDTVARRWRFQPFAVDGRARTTCSEVTFQIAFE